MKHRNDPQQSWLFDPSMGAYSEQARRRLLENWPGVFRTCILDLMPVEEVGGQFSETMGRPTKELYSACGLLLLMEFNDWTVEEAADAYMFDGRVQFALNLGRDNQSLSTRTIERYQAIFRDKEIAQGLANRVTSHLVEVLELKVDKLRLDSTHVFSSMAHFGRTRLMMTVTRRFLTQLKRHEPESYSTLCEELRERYQKKSWDFSKGGKGRLSSEAVAADMYLLIGRYEDNESINTRSTFKDMVQVFSEQCELIEDKVVIRKKTGGNVLQNPSDQDATFDGHKGVGYQVQTAETYSDENEVQLIVSTIPQTACEHDQNAVEKVVDDLAANEITPSDIIADAGYGGDENYCACRERGIKLTAPIIQGSQKKGRIELCEFGLNSKGCITSCPAGFKPLNAWFSEEKNRGAATFDAKHCQACEKRNLCLAKKNGKNYYVYYDSRALRIVERKLDMRTTQTTTDYAKRSGVEAAYSIGKRTMGLGRLRVRGKSSVYHAILMRIIGFNIIRASRSSKMLEMVKNKMHDPSIAQLKKQIQSMWNDLTDKLMPPSTLIALRRPSLSEAAIRF